MIGILSWFYLPPSPTQSAGGLRGKDGWFSEREEIIMVNRILRDDPSKVCQRYKSAILLIANLSDRVECTTDKA